MTDGIQMSDQHPEIRLLWSDGMPDELTAEEVGRLEAEGFKMFGWYDKDEDAIGFKFMTNRSLDTWTYFTVCRTPVHKVTAEDFETFGTYIGLTTNIAGETAGSFEGQINVVAGLIRAFRARRGLDES